MKRRRPVASPGESTTPPPRVASRLIASLPPREAPLFLAAPFLPISIRPGNWKRTASTVQLPSLFRETLERANSAVLSLSHPPTPHPERLESSFPRDEMERVTRIGEIESIMLSRVSLARADIHFKEKVAADLRLDYARGSSKRARATSDSL